MTAATTSTRRATTAGGSRSRAWTDWLLAAIEGWRWPIGWSLVGLYMVGVVLLHAVEWTLGALAPGELSLFIATLPLYPIGILAFLALLNRVSLAALDRFRPATDMSEEEYRHVQRDLTSQPAGSALAAGLIFGLLGAIIELTKDTAPEQMERYPVAFAVYVAVGFFFYAFAGPWLVRAYRLLRLVGRLHEQATRINLLQPEPSHAFSVVTSVVGLSLIAITSLSIATDPATHATTAGTILTAILLIVTLACFVAPLWGMHRRLQAEKARQLSEIGARMERTIERLIASVDEDRPGIAEERDRLSALTSARELTARQSTWPWSAETPRWLLSAMGIPIALWFATRFLERAGI